MNSQAQEILNRGKNMKITIANLKHSPSLSQETHAFTATVLVDGVRAFHASNHGHGGPDFYDPIKGYTGPSENEINEWLKNNTPKIKEYGMELDNSLDIVVGDLINDALRMKEIKKMVKTKILVIEEKDGKKALYSYKGKPTPETIERMNAHITAGKIKGRLVNGGDDALLEEASKLI